MRKNALGLFPSVSGNYQIAAAEGTPSLQTHASSLRQAEPRRSASGDHPSSHDELGPFLIAFLSSH